MSRDSNGMYRMMVWTYRIQDLFIKPGEALLEFGIRKGDTVVDYGCGPGRYIARASELVGDEGKVIAADIHRVALEYVGRRIQRLGLSNVFPVLVDEKGGNIADGAADIIFALDMFHLVDDSAAFLENLRRIVKPGGFLILEDGHQDRKITLNKVGRSGLWQVDRQEDHYIRLAPAAQSEE